MKHLKLLSLGLLTGLLSVSCHSHTTQISDSGSGSFKSYFENVPFEMKVLERPEFPNRIANILDYGAVNNGITLNTEAINRAIQDIAQKGGGTVVIPEGIWNTGPITLMDNINLHAEANSLIIFDPNPELYPIIETSFEGLNTRRSTSPINAKGATNIAITGKGVFDGSGDAWRFVKKGKLTSSQWNALVASGGILNEKKDTWYPSEQSMLGHKISDSFNNPQNLKEDAEWEAIHHWLRPVLLSFVKCKGVFLEGVTFRNSPAWCLHPLSCEDVILSDLKIFNPWYSQNGDGLDLESCKNALIVNCLFDVGDDAMCIKSGKDKDGRDRNEPCENVILKNNVVLHGHGGFVVGSEMSGGVKNIHVADCLFLGTDVGLRFKSTRGRGGVVENIWIENINMVDIPTEPLLFDLFYSGKSAMEDLEEGREANFDLPPVTEETPSFRNIFIKDVKCKGARRAMFFNGLPEMKIQNIQVENAIITSRFGAELVHASGVILKNVQILPEEGPKVKIQYSNDVTIEGEKLPDSEKTAIEIK
ncbi:glycoside hydrolase family 28 protein [Bacteroides sp. 519]|uniref:glycoside hydrolase family 28 protein n=1 Tax=Bacteroides sp. 519 TaxID=2302937 RepID=UPI0013D5F13D|nr:glycoside hydrolase family 28 protein [Bacteroides sp. 519]NDV57184.1 glycoside hydrolase family 28 protein [Bacteroides sp. 519]